MDSKEYNRDYRVRNRKKIKISKNLYYRKNRERLLKISKQYYHDNIEKVKEQKIQWFNRNKQHINKIRSQKYAHNLDYKLKAKLRGVLHQALRIYFEKGLILRTKYPIDLKAIINHLGTCPGSRKEWHVHHVKPICFFDFTDIEQIKQAYAPENHKWFPAKENISLGQRIRP